MIDAPSTRLRGGTDLPTNGRTHDGASKIERLPASISWRRRRRDVGRDTATVDYFAGTRAFPVAFALEYNWNRGRTLG